MPESEIAHHDYSKEALFRELAGERLEAMPGLIDLLKASEAKGIKRVLVTNAPRCDTVDRHLRVS